MAAGQGRLALVFHGTEYLLSLDRILATLALAILLASASAATSNAGSVTLAWRAPGGDSLMGRASRYDLRSSTQWITLENFGQADSALGLPIPEAPGTLQSYTSAGLQSGVIYFFAIKTSDQAGNWSAMSNVFWCVPRDTVPIPAAPALMSPEDGATGVATGPTLAWQASGGATSYRLQVAREPDFGSLLADQVGIVGTSYTVGGLANDSTYHWRVQASGEGGLSAWSNVRSFRTVAPAPMAPPQPALMSPEDGATGVATGPTLAWQASSGATSYRLQVAREPDFGSLLADQGGIAGTSYTLGGLANDSTYHWRVQASGEGGLSAWSCVRSFRTVALPPVAPPQPALMSPEDGATGVATGPTLAWQASGGATSYRLQVAREPDFGSLLADQVGIEGTSYTVGGLANDSTYHWRVQASGGGGLSAWSSVRSFRTVAPAPVAPQGISFSAPWPNPARDIAHFAWVLPAPAELNVQIFDLSGRRVRVLLEGPHEMGRGGLAWDLRDDRGTSLPGGIYLVRARLGDVSFFRRVAIAR